MSTFRSIYSPIKSSKSILNRLDSCRSMLRSPVTGSHSLNAIRHFTGLQRNQHRVLYPASYLNRTLVAGISRRDVSLPKLVYLQYPYKYLKAKFDLLRLKYLWDPSFKEDEFKVGTTQAAVLLTKLIRDQNLTEINNLTTTSGFKQIARDMILSRQDPRMKLLKFRFSDIKKAIPVRIYFVERHGRKHCIIDMFFVGMRNINDFDSDEKSEIQDSIRKYDNKQTDSNPETGSNVDPTSSKRRVVFAEIFTRFYREYGVANPDDWAVAFYKIATFDVLAF